MSCDIRPIRRRRRVSDPAHVGYESLRVSLIKSSLGYYILATKRMRASEPETGAHDLREG